MEETIITRRTAILAKEIGFNWECLYACDETFAKYTNPYSTPVNHNIELHSDETCSRPTQSLLQKWLREVHYVVVDVFQESKYKEYTGKWQVDISRIGDYQEENYPNPIVLGDTYEESLEKGVFEALKLIKL